jgi:hypothetical protein
MRDYSIEHIITHSYSTTTQTLQSMPSKKGTRTPSTDANIRKKKRKGELLNTCSHTHTLSKQNHQQHAMHVTNFINSVSILQLYSTNPIENAKNKEQKKSHQTKTTQRTRANSPRINFKQIDISTFSFFFK